MSSEPSTGRERVRTITERQARKGHGMPFYLLVFATAVLVLNAVFGDKGVLALSRAQRQQARMVVELDRARDENARLREEMRRLREDPATIEDIARTELGLIKPGEKVFIIRDRPPTATLPPPAAQPPAAPPAK
jgi:cell division protein FtsB